MTHTQNNKSVNNNYPILVYCMANIIPARQYITKYIKQTKNVRRKLSNYCNRFSEEISTTTTQSTSSAVKVIFLYFKIKTHSTLQ